MNPSRYLKQIVRPSFDRYQENHCDESLLYSCIVLIYHITDHAADHFGETKPKIIMNIKSQFPDFQLIQALANAQKHVIYSKGANNPYIGLSADHIGITTLTLNGMPVTLNGMTVSLHAPIIFLPNGEQREILPIVQDTLIFLEKLYGAS